MDQHRLRSLLDRIGATNEDLFCTIHRIDNNRIATLYSSNPVPERIGSWQPITKGLVGRALVERRVIKAQDVQGYQEYVRVYPYTRSELVIPIISSGKVEAIVNFESSQIGFFDDSKTHFQLAAQEIAEYFFLSEPSENTKLLLSYTNIVTTASSEELIVFQGDITDSLLKELSRSPIKILDISPRKFEMLIASILEDMGFEIELTPMSKDGGRDILAVTHLPTGPILTIVECKKWSQTNPVPVEFVRNLYGVLSIERASQAMIATTSHFTRDAKELADTLSYQMSLKDFNDIAGWLKRYE